MIVFLRHLCDSLTRLVSVLVLKHSPLRPHTVWDHCFRPVGEWRTVCTGVNLQLMRKSAPVVEACPKWASARAGVNESIKTFNEREPKMKEGEEKMERGRLLWRGRWEWIWVPQWRQESDLRRLSCGSDLCQAAALSSLNACLSAAASLCSPCLWSLH